MATSGAKTVPMPMIPKRPTVTRLSSSADSVPSKPQAPSHGHHPHTAGSPVRLVDKPTATGKKRPEITIVCAHPMAEVGFRESKPDVKPSLPQPPERIAPMALLDVNNGLIAEKAPHVVPKPVPRISPRRNNTDASSDTANVSLKPQPSLPRHSVIKSDTIPGVDVSESKIGKNLNNNAVTAGPSQHMLQPEVLSVCRSTSLKSQHVLSPPSPSHQDPPGIPSRLAVSVTPANNETSDISPQQPLVAPGPPLPRSPTARIKLLSSCSSTVCYTNSHTTNDLITQDDKFTNRTINSGVNASDNVYAAISKPNRPTIIRPNKPNVNKGNGQHSDEDVNGLKSENNVPPKVVKDNCMKVNNKQKTDDKQCIHQSENESSNVNLKFLRTRLRKTVPDEICSTGDSFNSCTAADSCEHKTCVADQETLSFVRGIPPPIKPKPSTTPKPVIATKPASPSYSCSGSKFQQDEDKDLDSVKYKCNEQTVINVSEKDNASAIEAEVKTHMIKRPTIIRPARQSLVQSCSLETLNQSSNDTGGDHWNRNVDDNTSACTSQSVLKPPSPSQRPESMSVLPPTSPSKRLESMSVLQPPSPSKRSESMKNISKTVLYEENEYDKVIKLNEFKSANDVGDCVQPKPIPRAAARSRPMSMAILPVSRPPLPTIGPKISQPLKSNSSPPPRPHMSTTSKLPQKLDTDVEISERTCDQGVAPSLPASTLHGKAESITLHKAVQRPPPPKQVPRVVEMSSSNEEVSTFHRKAESVTPHKAVHRPSPPKQVPRVTEVSSSDEEESCAMAAELSDGLPEILSNEKQKDSSVDKSKKPSRPCAPPAAKRELNTTQKETENKNLELRLSDPSHRPSRPLSMLVKVAQPNHAKSEMSHAQSMVKQVSPPPTTPSPDHPSDQHTMEGPHGIALFDFQTGHDDELDFRAGDVITLVRSVDANWLVGKIGVRQGIFPCDFIDIKVPLPVQTGQQYLDLPEGDTPYCIALYNYAGQTDEDLSFLVGDSILLVERISSDWLKGKFGGKIGMFPSAFVEIKVDFSDTHGPSLQTHTMEQAPSHRQPRQSDSTLQPTSHEESLQRHTAVQKLGIALYDFEGGADSELIFKTGDQIVIDEFVDGSEDWRWGMIDGKRGMFPVMFVQEIT